MARELGTVVDAARVLNVRRQRVRQLYRTGLMPPGVVVRLGRQVRFDLDALDAWIRAGGTALPGGWRQTATV